MPRPSRSSYCFTVRPGMIIFLKVLACLITAGWALSLFVRSADDANASDKFAVWAIAGVAVVAGILAFPFRRAAITLLLVIVAALLVMAVFMKLPFGFEMPLWSRVLAASITSLPLYLAIALLVSAK